MRGALFAFALALLLAAVLTPLVRNLALRRGVVDSSGGRKVHARRVPRLGGIAVVAAFFAPLVVLAFTESSVARTFFSDPYRIVGLAAGGLLVAGLGVADDLRGVRAVHKLWVQCIAAAIAYGCGFRIDSIELPLIGSLEMGVFAVFVTTIWIVGIVNAFNLIDGLDGLAAGIAFFACVTNFVVTSLDPSSGLVMLLSGALGGAILGFLLYNFNPASIFMGDSGSMFLGYVLATTSLVGASVKSSTTVAILVPIIALGLPIVDTLFAMVRRVLERRPIFSPDKGHIHHRLLELGLTHRRAVLILYGVTIVLAGVAITVSLGRDWQIGVALVVLSLTITAVIRSTGYLRHIRRRPTGRPAFSEHVERFRQTVPVLLSGLKGSDGVTSLRVELLRFAEDSQLAALEIRNDGRSEDKWLEWRADSQVGPEELRDAIRAVYPLRGGGSLDFRWVSEQGDLSPEADVLLQLVVDACAEALHRLTTGTRAVRTRASRPEPSPPATGGTTVPSV